MTASYELGDKVRLIEHDRDAEVVELAIDLFGLAGHKELEGEIVEILDDTSTGWNYIVSFGDQLEEWPVTAEEIEKIEG